MSTEDFRALIRLALRECCGLSQKQAEQYGTHNLKIGAIGRAPEEPRSGTGAQTATGWMDVQCRGTQVPPAHPERPIRRS